MRAAWNPPRVGSHFRLLPYEFLLTQTIVYVTRVAIAVPTGEEMPGLSLNTLFILGYVNGG